MRARVVIAGGRSATSGVGGGDGDVGGAGARVKPRAGDGDGDGDYDDDRDGEGGALTWKKARPTPATILAKSRGHALKQKPARSAARLISTRPHALPRRGPMEARATPAKGPVRWWSQKGDRQRGEKKQRVRERGRGREGEERLRVQAIRMVRERGIEDVASRHQSGDQQAERRCHALRRRRRRVSRGRSTGQLRRGAYDMHAYASYP